MESSGARPEHGPDKGHRGRCTRRQGISRPGSLSLSFSLSSLFSPLLKRIHIHTQAARCTVPFRSVPFRTVRSFVRMFERTYPVPRAVSLLLSPPFATPFRASPLSSTRPIPSLAVLPSPTSLRPASRLSLALTLTLSQTNVGFVVYVYYVGSFGNFVFFHDDETRAFYRIYVRL